jgi:hypothetical protein
VYGFGLTEAKSDGITLTVAPHGNSGFEAVRSRRKDNDPMEENLAIGPNMLAEICGGFLTWMGSSMIVMPLVWWATASIHRFNIDWHAALVMGIGAPITYLITGLIERERNAGKKAN